MFLAFKLYYVEDAFKLREECGYAFAGGCLFASMWNQVSFPLVYQDPFPLLIDACNRGASVANRNLTRQTILG